MPKKYFILLFVIILIRIAAQEDKNDIEWQPTPGPMARVQKPRWGLG